MNYISVPSYLHPLVFKTNAPDEILYNLRLAWEKEFLNRTNKEFKNEVDFSEDPELKKMLKKKTARFLHNPEKNWGPMSCAIIGKKVENKEKEDLKKLKNE